MHNFSPDRPERHDRWFIIAIFCLAFCFHLWGVSRGWESGLLPGNEFRQTHTAISALFIDRDNDFSLAYPTPLLGKPWVVPYEFPLYQWSVVGVSRATGWPLIESARAVSLVCFYLALPAVWLLLGWLRLKPMLRFLALSLVLTCPLYIFYARAFLIETMALMFSLWFLLAYLEALARRNGWWLLTAIIAGCGAGLVKVMTFMLFLLPAALWTLVWLWRAREMGWSEIARRTGWGAAAVASPFGVTLGWIRFADHVKTLNLDASNFVSHAMMGYHFGTIADRLSAKNWLIYGHTVVTNIVTPGVLLVLALGLVWWGGKRRRWIGASLLCFAIAPAIFPILYAWHEYYFVANSLFLLAALGLVLAALLETRCPRWVAWALIVGCHALQIRAYVHDFYPVQRIVSPGGGGLAQLLRDVTAPDDVLIIAGQDWFPAIPFYAERRSLMFRRYRDSDTDYVRGALDQLKGERVAALILDQDTRTNRFLIEEARHRFDLSPEPVLTWHEADVYVRSDLRQLLITQLPWLPYDGVNLTPDANKAKPSGSLVQFPTLPAQIQRNFARFDPLPLRLQSEFAPVLIETDGSRVIAAHPRSCFWVAGTPGHKTITAEFGIFSSAYEGRDPKTAGDGAEFVIGINAPDGTQRVAFRRWLRPSLDAGDRGMQRAVVEVDLAEGEEYFFATNPGPAGDSAFDWAYWGSWQIR